MTVDEFLRKVASEQPRSETRAVPQEPPPDLRKKKSMMLTDFLAVPAGRTENRTFRYGHVLGPGLSAEELNAWQRRWPNHELPTDLRDLLGRINGIHLWADLDVGRSYQGIAPLNEWDLASAAMGAAPLPERYVAVSYHEDHAAYIVLGFQSGVYFLMDSAAPSENCSIGSNVGELLDHVWEHRLPPTGAR